MRFRQCNFGLILILLNCQISNFAFSYVENKQLIENKIIVLEGENQYKYNDCNFSNLEHQNNKNSCYELIIYLNVSLFKDFFDSTLNNIYTIDTYSFINNKIDKKLSFNLYNCSYISSTLPILFYNYNNFNDLNIDLNNLTNINNNLIEEVYILESEYAEYNYENLEYGNVLTDDGDEYNFEEVLTDIDFDLNTQYDGEGVKIGFIETGIPENEYLTDINYLIKPTSTYRSEHASMTSSIVKYFSPKSEFYFVAFANENHPQDYYRYMSCIDWLVEQNVNVINCSFGIADKYNLISSYTDKIISTYNITVIASSGNSYLYKDDKTGKISDIYCAFAPSNSYNTISVGSSSKDNYVSVFSTNGFRYFNDYDYKNENKKFDKDEEIEINELKLKPDILAPGGHIVGFNNFELLNGASFSAPIVTGIVSLLMQKDENYKIYPELVRSTLINSTNRARNTLIFDRDAGFGIISYEKVMNNFYLTPFTISHNKILDVFYSFDIFVENIKNIVISTSTIFNSNGGLNIEFPEPNIYGFTSYGQKIGECASVYYASKFTHSNFSGNLNFIFQLLNNNVPVNKEYRYGISYRIE